MGGEVGGGDARPGMEALTPAQRERISQNFRAAKALLARKRPLENAPSAENGGDGSMRKVAQLGYSVGRTPLAELNMNACSFRGGGSSFLKAVSPVKFGLCAAADDESQSTRKSVVSTVSAVDNSAVDCSVVCMPSSYMLEEDFDESLLKEIDVLCERKGSIKGENESLENKEEVVIELGNDRVCGSLKSVSDGNLMDRGLSGQAMASEHTVIEPVVSSSENAVADIHGMPDAYMNYLRSLNETQTKAACSDVSIPLMIVAGPGSGKTSTMVGRVLTLLSKGIGPNNILAMTFTTAAASEMRDRIGTVTGKSIAKDLLISTFHSFCLQLCRSHAEKLGRTPGFLIYGNGQQRRAVIEAVRLSENMRKTAQTCGVGMVGEGSSDVASDAHIYKDKSKRWQKFVTQAKASGKTPKDYQEMGNEVGATILENYNDILKSCNALDYHDLIFFSVMLLEDFPEVYKESQEQWKALVVDEFQDTSSMQYRLLKILASHKCVTIIGDDDQSIFSFNGADVCGFDSFRKDFPSHIEIRLNKNYRSTRCIVEAAVSLIHHNIKRCRLKQVMTDNSAGSKITIKECHNEEAQCAFVVDKIIELSSENSGTKDTFGSIAILYRRQISGKAFQISFRTRKIPFNVHGVAFYRKKIIRAIMAILQTALPGCNDAPFSKAFKALLTCEKEEKKKVIEHINKITSIRKCNFLSAASDIFSAKISGTFKRRLLVQGRKVLNTLEMISRLVQREQSISVVVTSVANLLPQNYLLEQRAVIDVEGGKYFNEDHDMRSVLQYLLDDVSNFLSTHLCYVDTKDGHLEKEKGCTSTIRAFLDLISDRERDNFRSRRTDNENSVTLTTVHQSKGLEWDTVFIVKANDTEIPLLHGFNGNDEEGGSTLEEERRLLYVAMTRARKKLYILYITMDSNWQLLQPSRFLKEIPTHLFEYQDELISDELQRNALVFRGTCTDPSTPNALEKSELPISANCLRSEINDIPLENSIDQYGSGTEFLKRFQVEDRSIVSHLFHQWAKKQAFQIPSRLLDKVGFVIDERLRSKAGKNKNVLHTLKACLKSDEALHFAQHVLRWEQMPADKRDHLTREKQEHFEKLRIEKSMSSSGATSKQISYLQSLGCTIQPTSRLHASRLIEQYKAL